MDSVHPGQRPHLRADAMCLPGSVGIQVGEFTYEFDGASRKSLDTLLTYADGSRSRRQLHELADGSADLYPLLDFLVDQRAATAQSSSSSLVTARDYCSLCRTLFPQCKDRLFLHPLWTGLASGTAARDVFVGWLLESYHFIEGANVRLPYATALCFQRPRAHEVRRALRTGVGSRRLLHRGSRNRRRREKSSGAC